MSRQRFRLNDGGVVDRSAEVTFTFDGEKLTGHPGDSLASALLANGIHLHGRSFKYHRPRGLLSLGPNDPNSLVEVGKDARRTPNCPATEIELYDGLTVASQNRLPSLRFDIQAVNQWISRFLPAGFYYKTFKWPRFMWEKVYEPFIRRSAGLGRPPTAEDPDRYEHVHHHCDVLVIGGGATGLSAARAAAHGGARVTLVDQAARFGGASCRKADTVDGKPFHSWVEETLAFLRTQPDVTIAPRMAVTGLYDHNVLIGYERITDHLADPPSHQPRGCLWIIRAKQIVVATGAEERPLVFDQNDRPGIMLSTAVRQLCDQFAVLAGKRIAILTNNDDAYLTASILHDAGAKVAAIIDTRKEPTEAVSAAGAMGLETVLNARPCRATGKFRVRALEYQVGSEKPVRVRCDAVAVSGGFNPNLQLLSQNGGAPVWREEIAAFLPAPTPPSIWPAGAVAGEYSLPGCVESGHRAGERAARACGFVNNDFGLPASAAPNRQNLIVPLWYTPGCDESGAKAFVDYQNDVTAFDITLADQEGYGAVEHIKRYTTLGMATDQGRFSNVNALGLLARLSEREIAEIGTTRFRPPTTPVPIAAYAGHNRSRAYRPIRQTPLHDQHVALGAAFVEAGLWLRPQYYRHSDETEAAAIFREAKQVRETVGVCDVSSLGKIDMFGTDSAEFLNRLYINGWKTLPAGKARYGLMLREDGMVLDDGTTSRLADNHYFMTTTTANAGPVLAHMEYAAQVLWPELDVQICAATDQWCGLAIAGPNARALLAEVFGGTLNLDDSNLPYLGVREFTWEHTRTRIFRISFSGELAFEIMVPWCMGPYLFARIWAARNRHGLVPYGTEALNVLRIEKGHVAGNELDGRSTARDMGLAKMMSSRKQYIGRVLADRPALNDPARPQLVGLRLTGKGRLRAGSHLLRKRRFASLDKSIGWVTSVAESPQLGGWIGLGYLSDGPSLHGKSIYAHFPLLKEVAKVQVCEPVFFDPLGERLNG